MSININVATIQPTNLVQGQQVTSDTVAKAASSIVDAFESAPKVSLPGGTSLRLPEGIQGQDAQALEQLFATVPPKELASIEARTHSVIA